MTRDKKKRLSGRLISILLFLIMTCSAGPSFAANGEPDYLKQEPVYGVRNIWYKLLDTANYAYGWEFPYTDSFFRHPSEKFSLKFAQGSLGLALSAFRSNTDIVDNQYEEYLTGAGFTDLFAFGYDKETTEDSLSGVIGMKEIRRFLKPQQFEYMITVMRSTVQENALLLYSGTETVFAGFSLLTPRRFQRLVYSISPTVSHRI